MSVRKQIIFVYKNWMNVTKTRQTPQLCFKPRPNAYPEFWMPPAEGPSGGWVSNELMGRCWRSRSVNCIRVSRVTDWMIDSWHVARGSRSRTFHCNISNCCTFIRPASLTIITSVLPAAELNKNKRLLLLSADAWNFSSGLFSLKISKTSLSGKCQ